MFEKGAAGCCGRAEVFSAGRLVAEPKSAAACGVKSPRVGKTRRTDVSSRRAPKANFRAHSLMTAAFSNIFFSRNFPFMAIFMYSESTFGVSSLYRWFVFGSTTL